MLNAYLLYAEHPWGCLCCHWYTTGTVGPLRPSIQPAAQFITAETAVCCRKLECNHKLNMVAIKWMENGEQQMLQNNACQLMDGMHGHVQSLHN